MITNIITRDQAASFCVEQKSLGKVVGFTSGAFDILHAGHVSYLEEAKKNCDFLVVGLNSDASVRQYKGQGRPINTQDNRAIVLAALKFVDKLFIFDEVNNNENIRRLKPEIYIKASDYESDSLSSKSIVEEYGGKVLLLPFKAGLSSTAILTKLSAANSQQAAGTQVAQVSYAPAQTIFVDRDGTLIEHVEYLHEPEKIAFIPGAFKALIKLKNAGFRIVMLTNQPGIGLGYFSKEDFFKVNRVILAKAHSEGLIFDKIYFCPHQVADNCPCRKPKTLMIQRAVEEMNCIIDKSFVIGDMSADVQLAINSACKSVLVTTGMAGADNQQVSDKANYKATGLAQAAEWILSQQKTNTSKD